jgi:hypothetical protein
VSFSLLSPLSLLVALGCVVPLLALTRVRAKARQVRSVVGLPEPSARSYVVPIAAVVSAGALVGLAAAQPVVEFEETSRLRTDAEALIVLDTTRSMLARPSRTARPRLARAKDLALELRLAVPTVPVGLASLTDRTLPHLFPSIDEQAFRATLMRSIGIERPPPVGGFLSRATKLESIASVATQGYFSPTARLRVLVVLTDGESVQPSGSRLDLAFRRPPEIRSLFVHVWGAEERVYAGRLPEPGYRSDPTARDTLERFATIVGGTVFTETQRSELGSSLRKILGSGPTVVRGERNEHVALAPFLAGSAFLPLLLLLWRRDR